MPRTSSALIGSTATASLRHAASAPRRARCKASATPFHFRRTSSAIFSSSASASRPGQKFMVVRILRPAASNTAFGVGLKCPPVAAAICSQQRLVVAVFEHLVFLAIKSDLRESARIRGRTNAEQALVLTDRQAPAIMAGGDLAHLERRLKAVWTEGEDIRNRRRLLDIAGQAGSPPPVRSRPGRNRRSSRSAARAAADRGRHSPRTGRSRAR